MTPDKIPPIKKVDHPELDRNYFVPSPWMADGEICEAKYVGEITHDDGPSTPMFRLDGSDILFPVSNPYAVRANLSDLRKTLAHWKRLEARRAIEAYERAQPDQLEKELKEIMDSEPCRHAVR